MVSDSIYCLHSKNPGEPSLGIWYFTTQQELAGEEAELSDQPVRLTADLIEVSVSCLQLSKTHTASSGSLDQKSLVGAPHALA